MPVQTDIQSQDIPNIESLLETSGMPPNLRLQVLEILGEDPGRAILKIAQYCAEQGQKIRRADRVISSKARLLERAEEIATRDALTGVYNRRKFDADLETAVREGIPCLIAYVDVRDFKQVNDQYGHPTGDRALQAIAKTLVSATRTGTGVYRPGGDEFTVIEKGEPGKELSLDIARAIEERLIHAGEKIPVRTGEQIITVAYDVGAVHYAGNCAADPEIFAKLKACADTNMYAAKIGAKQGIRIIPRVVTLDPRTPLDNYADALRMLKMQGRTQETMKPLRNYGRRMLAFVSQAAAYAAGIMGAVGQCYTQR